MFNRYTDNYRSRSCARDAVHSSRPHQTKQSMTKAMVATSVLEPGGFLGNELLSWRLRRPFIEHLPASSATYVCMETREAFDLDADSPKYISDNFHYKFAREKLRRTARYSSSYWRTWATVNIQFRLAKIQDED